MKIQEGYSNNSTWRDASRVNLPSMEPKVNQHQWLEYTAIVATIAFFCTNLLQINEFRKQRTTGKASIAPFLAQFVNCTLWLKYGLLIHNTTISSVNLVGFSISIVSLIAYYLYTHDKDKVERKVQVTMAFLVSLLVYVTVYFSERVIYQLGFVTAFFGVVMFGSPLVTVSQVVKGRSTDGLLSLPMSIASFVVCALWTSIGYIMEDVFVITPNFLGGILAAVQLLLLFVYRKSAGFLPVRNHSE
jgi:solute carrier family 50 protein (sugar transporter)